MLSSDAIGTEESGGDLADRRAVNAPVGRLEHVSLSTPLLRGQSDIGRNSPSQQRPQQAFDRLDPVKAIRIKRHDCGEARIG